MMRRGKWILTMAVANNRIGGFDTANQWARKLTCFLLQKELIKLFGAHNKCIHLLEINFVFERDKRRKVRKIL